MPSTTLRIATRKSPLALWQAEEVAARLRAAHPGLEVALLRMSTRGDKILDAPLAKVGGKGLFVKELEQGLMDGRADLAVHSMKDVPAELPPGLGILAMLAREDPRDALVAPGLSRLEALPAGARVGTSSLRRQTQLRERYPALRVSDLRGNVNTRLAKLDAGEFDALVLAAAGLKRLGLGERISALLEPGQSLPAIGQGAIGIEAREGDGRIATLLAPLNDADTALRVRAERALNARLAGGCQVPLAGHATLVDGRLRLAALVGRPDGSEVIRDVLEGPAGDPEGLGRELAERLIGQGADRILADLDLPAP